MNSKLNGQKSRSIATQKVMTRAAEKLIAKNALHDISSVATSEITRQRFYIRPWARWYLVPGMKAIVRKGP